jgi:hypothetical protein
VMEFAEHPTDRLGRIADRMMEAVSEEEKEDVRVIALVVEPGGEGKTIAALSGGGYAQNEHAMVNDLLNATQMAASASGVNMSIFEAPIGGQG